MAIGATITLMNDQAERRLALGEQIRAARRAKFGTVDGARISAGVSTTTWNRAESGQTVRDDRLTAIERALDWPQGAAFHLLAGYDPADVLTSPAIPPADSSLRRSIMESDEPGWIKRAMLALLDSERDPDDLSADGHSEATSDTA